MTRSLFWHVYYLIETDKAQDKLVSAKESTNKKPEEETSVVEDVPAVK